jgi:general secretion pathway protein D
VLSATLLPLSTLWLRAADSTSSDQPVTAAQAAQAESVQRQQYVMSANQAIADGTRFLNSGRYDDAAARFQYAVDALTPGGGALAAPYIRAQKGLAAAKSGQAGELAKNTKFAMAAQKLQEAINLDPTNPNYPQQFEELKKEQVAYQRQVDDPEGTIANPAVTDEFKDRVATVQKLLFQGDCFFRTGQYEKAEETYSKVLLLDPYNKAAREKMDHMEKYRMQAAKLRTDEYTGEQLEHVDHQWAQDISPDIVVKDEPVNPNTGPNNSQRAEITRKLQSIIIDKVNFDKLDITTVIQFLTAKSKELDPAHQGINFVLRLSSNTPAVDPNAPAAPGGAAPAPAPGAPGATPPPPIHREVSITLDNVPLIELLNYITEQTNLQFSVEDYAVYLRPSIDEGETLSVRTYLVPPNFFTGSNLRVTPSTTTDPSATTVQTVTVKVTDELASRGIRFPSGATATYLPGSSKLVVRDTPEQLDLIGSLIENLSKETPQIQIEAKIAEFTQDAIKALSFNYTVGTPQAPFINAGTGAQTALRTPDYTSSSPIGGITPNSINTLIAQNPGNTDTPTFPITGATVTPNASNVLTVGAIIDNTGLLATIQAINNTVGASLLAAPSVTTQNGQKASIDLVREFIYPSSFEKPKLSNSQVAYSQNSAFGGNIAGVPLQLAIPPTPRDFVEQDIGVNLEVKPTTYPDQRIDLDITKADVIDFDGFIDYGVPITELLSQPAPGSTNPTILTEGTINEPVFNLRSVVTNLQVLDGQTAVLGGLTREDTQEINDKVPGLGDLPLLGRLFQSKVSERTKYNLIFFITARLVRSNGKPEYVKTLDAEPQEEKLSEPDQAIGPGVTLPILPEGTPNS